MIGAKIFRRNFIGLWCNHKKALVNCILEITEKKEREREKRGKTPVGGLSLII